MLNALRSVRAPPPAALFSATLQNRIGRNASGVRFMQQAVPGDKQDSMEQSKKPTSKIADTMSSFGEGYATRSDEEGFGGVYGGNQYLNKEDEDKILDGGTTINDASQGSQVKETEKARNQKAVE